MKLTLEEIEEIINRLGAAMTHAKEARRTAKKVYGSESEISEQLRFAHIEAKAAITIFEKRG